MNIIIEHALKYADVDSIKMIIAEYGIDKCRTVWEKVLLSDDRLRKLIFFLARFIFNISLEDKKIDVYLKKHSKKELNGYMKFMTDKTGALFHELSNYNFLSDFTFVGGSAVAYYLSHQLSEDLDFFSWNSSLPAETDSFIKKISKTREVEIINYTYTYLDIFIDGSKITLFANDWNILKTNRKKIENNIYAADLTCYVQLK